MLHELKTKVENGAFEFSRHALDQSIVRQITVRELKQAIAVGEIIEDYPDDKYGPSCLILGMTDPWNDGRQSGAACPIFIPNAQCD